MILALVAAAAAAPPPSCAVTYGAAEVAAAVTDADRATEQMDSVGLSRARDVTLERLGCAQAPLGAPLVGAIHRVVATVASVEHRDERVAPALASMLVADPGVQLPFELYSPSDPVRLALPQAALLIRQGQLRSLAPPPGGRLQIDGLATGVASTSRPSVVQAFDASGALLESRYLWPEDDAGAWQPLASPSALGDLAAPSQTLPSEALMRGRARVPLLVATSATLLSTGVLYGVASAERGRFLDESVQRTDEELIALSQTTNRLTVGWAVTGVATLGLGAGLVIAW